MQKLCERHDSVAFKNHFYCYSNNVNHFLTLSALVFSKCGAVHHGQTSSLICPKDIVLEVLLFIQMQACKPKLTWPKHLQM